MLMMSLVLSSTASAVIVEPSDVYELTEDVGVMPLASNPVFYEDRYNVFSAAQLEVVKGFINKLPITQHYAMVYQFEKVGADYVLHYYVFVFDISELYDWQLIVGDAYMYDIVFKYDYDSSDPPVSSANWVLISQPVKVSNLVLSGRLGYSVSYEVNGRVVSKSGLSFISTDVPNSQRHNLVTVDISDRREVLPQYAAVFGLAVFLLLGIFRDMWRSIRGRAV